ncbi:aminopeptidase N-like [Chironomus tepperi]|uniref:aminopeptidase N-like n=1 Tax=Chironomus tepperi TaxID=113505 RepID=UPI00391EF80D
MRQILKYSVLFVLIINNIVSAYPQDSSSESQEVNKPAAYDNYRLPSSVVPENYKLDIFTHLNDSEGFIFRGIVEITLNVNEFCDNITLHAKNLTIDTKKIELNEISENEALKIRHVELMPKHDFLIIYPQKILSKFRKYTVKIPFEGSLDTDLVGYYRSSYFDKELNKRVWLSVTQFEATHAREAFPCFDEPEMKATFDISLAHHKMYSALSNMPLKETHAVESIQDFVVDTFETSVKMSTYLVAYCVSDFEYKEVSMKDDVTFRIYARREAMNQVDYAADVGPKVLKFYEDYFQIKFPLPKIDMIAVPDFSAGAMENWGLITYRETALLYQANASTLSAKHRVAEVIAHELAHQWFGNLVTMRWWTDLWLNEGFATYVASLGVAHLHPEWKSFDEESVDNTLDIFKVDALKSSHPVSVTIGHPNQISQIFDAISYSKGSVVIRMCHKFLGERGFRFGVSNYLKKHQYANTLQDDLWDSLTESSHEEQSLSRSLSVKDIMDSWTLQVGYPVIEVVRDYDTNSATLTQSRYVSDRYTPRNELNSCWWIPLTYTDNSRKNFTSAAAQDWMSCTKDKEAIEKKIHNLPDQNNWVIFNIQLAGLYKVKYDEQNYKLLVETLNSEDYNTINVINRAQLIDDAMDLAWVGRQDYGIALDMINYLKRESEYIPWKAALDNLRIVNRLLLRSPLYGVFKAYMRHILKPIYGRLGGISTVPDSSELHAVKHQALICGWSCRLDVGDCIKRSVEYFNTWMVETEPDHINPIPLNLRPCIYCTAVRNGNEKQWKFLWQRYVNSNVGAEKSMIISALSCAKEQWILSRYLEWSLNSTLVRKQDASIVFSGVARDEIGFHLARNFFFDRIDDIYSTLFPDTSRLTRYIKPLAEQMSTQKELTDLKDLVTKKAKEFEKSTQGVKQALEVVELNNQWKLNNYFSLARNLNRMIDPETDMYTENTLSDEITTTESILV